MVADVLMEHRPGWNDNVLKHEKKMETNDVMACMLEPIFSRKGLRGSSCFRGCIGNPPREKISVITVPLFSCRPPADGHKMSTNQPDGLRPQLRESVAEMRTK